MSSTLSKMIVLKSSDGETYELDETVALASQTIKHMIEDGCADSVIPVPNITSKILEKVIEYCNKHAETPMDKNKVSEEDLKVSVEDLKVSVEDLKVTEEDPKVTEEAPKVSVDDLKVSEEDLKAFDAEFVQVDQDTLFAIILAANYLNIKSLLELTCKAVADMARGKTVQEIRDHFNIKNDLTPEEEEQIALENAWAFDHDDKSDVTTPAEDEQTQEEQA